MPALEVQYRNRSTVLEIQVGNTLLSQDQLRFVDNVKVTHNKDKADTLELIFNDPDLLIMNGNVITPRSLFIIYCGWDDEVETKGPFRVSGWEPRCPASGKAQLIIQGTSQDVSRMALRPKSVSYVGYKPSEIIKNIGSQYGFDFDVDILPTDDVVFDKDHPLNQVQKSDANLLTKLASDLGYVWGVRNGVLYFNRPDKLNKNPLIFEWRVGKKTLKSFKPNIKIFKSGKPKAKVCASNTDVSQIALSSLMVAPAIGGAGALASRPASNVINNSLNYMVEELDADPNQAAFAGGSGSDGGFNISELQGTIKGVTAKTSAIEDIVGDIGNKIKNKKRKPRNRNVDSESSGGFKYTLDDTTFELVRTKINNFKDGVKDAQKKVSNIRKDLKEVDGENQRLASINKDKYQSMPRNKERAKKFLQKQTKILSRAVEATLVPTVPSWVWETKESVYVLGVADICEGLYYVNKVILTYDNQKALGTTLECVKGTLGSKKTEKDCKERKMEVCIQEKILKLADTNPRKTLENPKKRSEPAIGQTTVNKRTSRYRYGLNGTDLSKVKQ